MSSSGPCIWEVDDIIGGRRVLLLCFLLRVLPPPSATQPVPLSTPGRGRPPCPMCQPNISCCTTALLAEYLEASWSSWAAQMRVLTPAGSLATTHPCTNRYHCALGSSGRNCSSCYGGDMIFCCHPTALWDCPVAPGCGRCPQIWEL